MGFEEQSNLLTRYNEWKGQKKVAANDYSPEAFLVYEAQNEAYQRVEKAIAYVANLDSNDISLEVRDLLLNILEDN